MAKWLWALMVPLGEPPGRVSHLSEISPSLLLLLHSNNQPFMLTVLLCILQICLSTHWIHMLMDLLQIPSSAISIACNSLYIKLAFLVWFPKRPASVDHLQNLLWLSGSHLLFFML